MAISDNTKRIVVERKVQLQSQYNQNVRELARLNNQVALIEARMETLLEDIGSLDADIPEPTLSEEPV